MIELNARFDEERNIHWSRELESVGAHVVFGVSGLKTHSKTALVVRKEETGIRSYAHIATGNYHSRTAKLYEDIGLLTTDPRITGDVVTLFNFLTGRSRTRSSARWWSRRSTCAPDSSSWSNARSQTTRPAVRRGSCAR